jgi:predicted DNA-binding transcriptional regulator AlpA
MSSASTHFLLPGLLAGETRLADVAPETAAVLLEELRPLVAQLALRAQEMVRSSSGTATPSAPPEERLLKPRETAERLGVKVQWLYRHADEYTFTRRLTRRTLRFSEAGLARFLAQKRS